MYLLRIGSILTLVLMTGFSMGQPNYRFFYGRVIDGSSNAAISNVNFSFTGTKTGTISDRRGSFSFFIDTIPVYMIVSHIGYETQKIWLDGTSFEMTIKLDRMVTTLEEVEIRSINPPEPFYRDQSYAVLDYAIDSSRIYILVYRYSLSASQLICKSTSGDTIGISNLLPFRPTRLFRDCLGFLHILSPDSSYQVFLQENHIFLMFAASLTRFMETLNDCVASTDKLLFFKRMVSNGLGIEFYTVDRISSRRELMAVMEDQKKMTMLNRNKDDLRLMQMEKPPDSRSDFVQWSFAKKVLYRPNTSAMYPLGDRLCVFNSVEKSIEFYSFNADFNGKLLLQFGSVTEGKWTQEIYTDATETKVYTSFNRNGTYILYRINLNTGDLRRVVPLNHLFPQRIRIDNGFVYYLYDVPEKPDNKQLFRQKL